MGEELRRGGLVGGLPRTARIDGARDDRDRGGDDRRDVPAQLTGRRAGAAVQRADGGALRQYRQLPEAALLPEPARRRLLERQRRTGVDSRPAEPIAGGMALSPAEPLRFHPRSEEHTSELQSLMRISYAVFCLKKNT